MTAKSTTPQPRFPRHEPEAGLERAEAALIEEMEHAAELLHSEEDFGRKGVTHALHACYSFLHVRGLSGQGLKPLRDLTLAFEAVEKGTLPELFDPKVISGEMPNRTWSRSPASSQTKLHAAACMDALMKGDHKKGEAAKRVARFACKWPRMSRGIIEAHTVANWRDELLQQASNNPDRQILERLSKMLSDGPRAQAYLTDALRKGPVMTGGVQPSKT